MSKLLETLISLFKMLVVTLIIVAGFIGFGRIVNWFKNGFSGVYEEKATQLGLKILGWWLLVFIMVFVVAMASDEYSSRYDLAIQIGAYWILLGLVVWFVGLFGYALNEIPEDSTADSNVRS